MGRRYEHKVISGRVEEWYPAGHSTNGDVRWRRCPRVRRRSGLLITRYPHTWVGSLELNRLRYILGHYKGQSGGMFAWAGSI